MLLHMLRYQKLVAWWHSALFNRQQLKITDKIKIYRQDSLTPQFDCPKMTMLLYATKEKETLVASNMLHSMLPCYQFQKINLDAMLPSFFLVAYTPSYFPIILLNYFFFAHWPINTYPASTLVKSNFLIVGNSIIYNFKVKQERHLILK